MPSCGSGLSSLAFGVSILLSNELSSEGGGVETGVPGTNVFPNSGFTGRMSLERVSVVPGLLLEGATAGELDDEGAS